MINRPMLDRRERLYGLLGRSERHGDVLRLTNICQTLNTAMERHWGVLSVIEPELQQPQSSTEVPRTSGNADGGVGSDNVVNPVAVSPPIGSVTPENESVVQSDADAMHGNATESLTGPLNSSGTGCSGGAIPPSVVDATAANANSSAEDADARVRALFSRAPM
ncbi:hypothetical protein ERJ75_000747600 [Trypanosoma vivax]|nr:hypothetical protein ERJ75_000747600 [Trypanosoma vivax]